MEEIIGLDGIRPVREWYGYAFGLPDRHPTSDRGAVRCPCVVAGPGWLVGSCGAWWFENWIVDASKRNFGFFLLIAISPNSSIEFGFEIDRFVIILVLRFVVWRSCYQETRGWDNGLAVVPLARAYGGCLGRQYR